MKPRLYKKYHEEIVTALRNESGMSNPHQVPRLVKITLNMGVRSDSEKGAVEEAVKEMAAISGQKPVITKARQSVANFKLRKGMPVGCKVTLRRDRMYEFLDRLISTALPRIRDFRGISSKKFDGRGSYSIGLSDQSIFPEIELEKIKRQQGLDVTIVTSGGSDERARMLLSAFGMPFVK